jgi:hypothetical protein
MYLSSIGRQLLAGHRDTLHRRISSSGFMICGFWNVTNDMEYLILELQWYKWSYSKYYPMQKVFFVRAATIVCGTISNVRGTTGTSGGRG